MADPWLSLIIPVYNAASLLRSCLESVGRMDVPRDCLEVIVVDNGSTDASAQVASARGARVVFEPRRNPYTARNTGASHARGEVLGFTDADCILDPGWAGAVREALETLDAVCGQSLGAPGGPVSRLVQARYAQNYSARVARGLGVFDTRNAAVKRSWFERVGGFDDRLDEYSDDLFGIALREAGARVGVWERMRVSHVHPESFEGVWRRQLRHGRAIPLVLSLYPAKVHAYFPGISRHRWLMARPGSPLNRAVAWACRALGLGLSGGVRACLAMGAWPCASILFDLFCRAGTVCGLALSSSPGACPTPGGATGPGVPPGPNP